MSPLATPAEANSATAAIRPDPYQVVTDLIIQHLETGVVPWRCPWNRDVGQPRNFVSGQPYRGINSLLLGCHAAPSPWWLTFNQAKARGGHIRKGAKGALVVKYGTFTPKGQSAPETTETPAASGATNRRREARFLRIFVVFNASQIEGIAFPESEVSPSPPPEARIAAAERIVSDMPRRPTVHEGRGTRALYRPATDEIDMPAFAAFESVEAYYQTLFHECVHATGHASRLNRESLTKHDEFGGPVYSQEELVAEMGAAFVGMDAGIVNDNHEQSAAYLQGWLSALKAKEHRRWMVQAAAQASRAADFILNRLEQPSASTPN